MERQREPGAARIATRLFIGGAAVMIIVVVAVSAAQTAGLGALFSVLAIAIGVAGHWFIALEAARKAVAIRRHFRLYRLFRLMNQVLRHDIGGKLADVRYSIETSGVAENEGIAMAYEAAAEGIDRIRQMKALEALAEKDSPLFAMDVRAVAAAAAETSHFPVKISGSAAVLADEALHSVFENLIKNAKVHSGADRMAIDMREEGGTVVIVFTDSGKGIPEKYRDQLFTEGYALGTRGDTGLGLYIARETVERYGGSIRYEEADPHGARFVLNLKKA